MVGVVEWIVQTKNDLVSSSININEFSVYTHYRVGDCSTRFGLHIQISMVEICIQS